MILRAFFTHGTKTAEVMRRGTDGQTVRRSAMLIRRSYDPDEPFLNLLPTCEREHLDVQASVIDGGTIEIQDQRIRYDGIEALDGRQTCTVSKSHPWLSGKAAVFARSDKIGTATVHGSFIFLRHEMAEMWL